MFRNKKKAPSEVLFLLYVSFPWQFHMVQQGGTDSSIGRNQQFHVLELTVPLYVTIVGLFVNVF